ncbi:hypothetical protein [Subtercola endophyticus]|uniref:hypothetical protein n=1 Tax=Subtercola endophyticus TaxID=2895559 RepID=UPI001E5B4E3C|nr:hypothetical protein [Subtercola endophyticus]UFS57432.1 hypothetical protein LQ955_10175 [Subtercola endophyticus]
MSDYEDRLPVLIAVLVNLALLYFIPQKFQVLPSWLVPAIAGALLIPLVIQNPRRLCRETTLSRWISIVLTSFLVLANQITVLVTIENLLNGDADGKDVLLSALQVWLSSVITFGLVYWELDHGGPVARREAGGWHAAGADFRFPQNDGGDEGGADGSTDGSPADSRQWRPGYIDYFYVAFTNMIAFSPTDTMPMTSRAKLIMAFQSIGAFVLLALVVSRAVNILA